MPEYLAPGVFVEEVSFRQKSIEGVSTSTAGFVGPTRFGPVSGEPELLTSFADFERIYGGIDQLEFDDAGSPGDNYLAHAVRAFFDEGGKRLYVARTYDPPAASPEEEHPGSSRWEPETSPPGFQIRARHPGRAGDLRLQLVFRAGQNVLDGDTLRGVSDHDVVVVTSAESPPASPPGDGELYWVERTADGAFLLTDTAGTRESLAAVLGSPAPPLDVRVLRVTVLASPLGRFSPELSWVDLALHPAHRQGLSQVFAAEPSSRATELFVPVVFESGTQNGAALAEDLLAAGGIALATLVDPAASDAARTWSLELENGSDGNTPGLAQYDGDEDAEGHKSGLLAFEDIEDISIVAAPGSTVTAGSTTDAVVRAVIRHCELMRYRIAVLDSVAGQLVSEVREMRGRIDTTHAALYYPWVRIVDPLTEGEIHLPPSGFVAGIYARNDIDRGVHKAPANEVIRSAIGFERLVNKGQQEVLNPEGINCLRFFEGRGFRVWGARTATSDPEWKYVNLRRYFAFLERSIEKGTQFAVFEPNGPVLWSNIRQTVSDFLFNEWKSNHLLGAKPEEAFFVRCDRTTMTQNDLDNGRLICLVGVAPLRPAEFVIFRIGQKTADARS